MDWFNSVDETYRNQLKEINDLNWERVKAEIVAVKSELRAEMAAMRADLIKWMFAFWIGNVVAVGGLIVGMKLF